MLPPKRKYTKPPTRAPRGPNVKPKYELRMPVARAGAAPTAPTAPAVPEAYAGGPNMAEYEDPINFATYDEMVEYINERGYNVTKNILQCMVNGRPYLRRRYPMLVTKM